MKMIVFILESSYPSRRASANIKRRIAKGNSSRRVTRLVPVFILETHNLTNSKMFAEARPDG